MEGGEGVGKKGEEGTLEGDKVGDGGRGGNQKGQKVGLKKS